MKAELESAEYKQKLQVVTSKYGQAQKELQVRRLLPVERWSRGSAHFCRCEVIYVIEFILFFHPPPYDENIHANYQLKYVLC